MALYHRVSTLDQNATLARDELGGWVARQGGTVALAIEETGSGARNNRPGLRRVLDAAHRGEIDCVTVWKLDRWGRSTMDVIANIEALKTSGVRFVAISQGIDIKPSGDAMSGLILTVLAGVAEFERELIRERTLLGLARARKEGRKGGRPRTQHPTPEQVRKLRNGGKSWPEIAAEFGCSVMQARRRFAESAAPRQEVTRLHAEGLGELPQGSQGDTAPSLDPLVVPKAEPALHHVLLCEPVLRPQLANACPEAGAVALEVGGVHGPRR